jgi:hypothetical protein
MGGVFDAFHDLVSALVLVIANCVVVKGWADA